MRARRHSADIVVWESDWISRQQTMTRKQATGIAYDSSLEALTEPGNNGNFFQLHQPESAAAWCAEFSRLAYADFSTMLRPGLATAGFELVAEPFDSEGTQAFLAQGPVFAVLSFRGSDDLVAWQTNLDVIPAPWRGGGKTHRGFAEALDLVWEDVDGALARISGPLLFTGHSQGAALATLAASLVPEAALYTYGSPRVGNGAFRAKLADRHRVAKRYVNHRDIVCRVPPASIGYRHVGMPYLIDRVGKVTQRRPNDRGLHGFLASALPTNRQSLAQRFGQTLPRELTDHAPINYVSALS